MAREHIEIAIAHDFDDTLADGNMQEHQCALPFSRGAKAMKLPWPIRAAGSQVVGGQNDDDGGRVCTIW